MKKITPLLPTEESSIISELKAEAEVVALQRLADDMEIRKAGQASPIDPTPYEWKG